MPGQVLITCGATLLDALMSILSCVLHTLTPVTGGLPVLHTPVVSVSARPQKSIRLYVLCCISPYTALFERSDKAYLLFLNGLRSFYTKKSGLSIVY